MPDWNAEVRKNLRNLGLTPQQQEEVIAELAGHLQDHYEQLRAQGVSESEALERSLQQASGWRQMSRRIRNAKHEEDGMNYRTRALWLPGLAALAAASVFLMVLQLAGVQPKIWWKDGGAVVLHFPWLMLLPLCGAGGAYLSLRAGGRRVARLAAGLFPALMMLAVFCVMLPAGLFVDLLVGRNGYAFILRHPVYFVLTILNWTVLPGLALLVGAAPLCSKSSTHASAGAP
jgi:hypothetical protein